MPVASCWRFASRPRAAAVDRTARPGTRSGAARGRPATGTPARRRRSGTAPRAQGVVVRAQFERPIVERLQRMPRFGWKGVRQFTTDELYFLFGPGRVRGLDLTQRFA